MITLDLRKELKGLYQPSAKAVQVVEVPRFKFLMIDGEIEPGHGPGDSPSFAVAMQAMYGLAYTLKFSSKKRAENPIDYPVMPLEGLWWTDSGEYDLTHPEGWKYTLLIYQPEHISAEMLEAAREQVGKKRPSAALGEVRLGEFEEGRCIQIMHIGPYSEEMRTIAVMDAFAAGHDYRMRGKHHEIYLSDPRRARPEKMKTVLRHPVEG